MISFLLILQVIIVILIVVVVLIQKSSSIGLGVYTSSNETLFGAKGPGGFLTKITIFLSVLFLLNTLLMGYMYNSQYKKSQLVEEISSKQIKTNTVAKDSNSTNNNNNVITTKDTTNSIKEVPLAPTTSKEQ